MMAALDAVVDTFGPPHAIVAHSLGCAITAFAIADGLSAPARLGFVAPTVGPLPHMHAMTQLLGLTERTESAILRQFETMVGRPITDFDALTLPGPMPPTLIVHDYRDKKNSHAQAVTLAATLAIGKAPLHRRPRPPADPPRRRRRQAHHQLRHPTAIGVDHRDATFPGLCSKHPESFLDTRNEASRQGAMMSAFTLPQRTGQVPLTDDRRRSAIASACAAGDRV